MVRNMIQRVLSPKARKGRSGIKPWCFRVILFLSGLRVQNVNYMVKTLISMIFQCKSGN